MRHLKLAILFTIALTVGGPAHALINPHFTPIHLVKQWTLIALVKLSAPDAKGLLTARVLKSLKGKAPADKVTIALLPDWIKPLANDAAAAGDGPGLLFACKGEDQQETALLHLAGHWLRLEAKGAADFAMKADDVEMRGTWAGGSDMLAKAVEYIMSAADPVVPVAVGCTWSSASCWARSTARSTRPRPCDLAGKGPIALFIAADKGDRVYRYDAAKKDFADITAKLGLVSRSKLAAWADFTGHGKCDLASWDGKCFGLGPGGRRHVPRQGRRSGRRSCGRVPRPERAGRWRAGPRGASGRHGGGARAPGAAARRLVQGG